MKYRVFLTRNNREFTSVVVNAADEDTAAEIASDVAGSLDWETDVDDFDNEDVERIVAVDDDEVAINEENEQAA